MTTDKDNHFSHLDAQGNARMVDVGHKQASRRRAIAEATVIFPSDVYAQIQRSGGQTSKGAITDVARIAGIMAGKKTSDLIPLCHPLPLDAVNIAFTEQEATHSIHITATTEVTHKTGVEMEALTAVSVAALTLYDMCKALSHDITITDVRLVEKSGGKSDFGRAFQSHELSHNG